MPEVMSHNKKHAEVSRSEVHETSFSQPSKVTDNDASLYIQNEAYPVMPDAHGIEYGSMQTIAKDSEIACGEDVILKALKPSTSTYGSTQIKVKGSRIGHGDDVIGITLETYQLPSQTDELSSEVDDSEIAHGDDVIGITAEAL